MRIEDAIVELGERAVQPLIALMRDPDLMDEFGENCVWARTKAAYLLGRLKHPDGVAALFDLIEREPSDPILLSLRSPLRMNLAPTL